jgi:hypothetical protein
VGARTPAARPPSGYRERGQLFGLRQLIPEGPLAQNHPPGLERGRHQLAVMRHLHGDNDEINLVAVRQFFRGAESERHVVGLARCRD